MLDEDQPAVGSEHPPDLAEGGEDIRDRAEGPAQGQAERYSSTRRSRSALAITDTELKLIAALATIGLRRTPSQG